MRSRGHIAVLALLVPLALWLTLPLLSSGAPVASSASNAQSKLSSADSSLGAVTQRIHGIDRTLAPVRQRLAAAQASLDAQRARLLRTHAQLRANRIRLAELQRRLRRSEHALGDNLLHGYEAGRIDIVQILLEARGFADLLERADFLQRVRDQDVRIFTAVRRARAAVIREATRLGALQARQQQLATSILRQRDAVAAIELRLASTRAGFAAQRARLQAERASLRKQLAKAAAASSGPSSGSSSRAAPHDVSSGGGFTFPLPKSAASSPDSWSLDDGVDISAPGHTPLYAVGSGTIVLHGIGGFGDSAPVLHLDDGRYVYYGHAGPGNWTPVGTHVGAGQVISEVGDGIVGISTGPHLEIGFAGSSGGPLGPSTAPQMMALLRGSYG